MIVARSEAFFFYTAYTRSVAGAQSLTCTCKEDMWILRPEIYDKKPDICLAQKMSQPSNYVRLPPHPHPGTSAIIFTTGNSKVVNSFRGWCFHCEMVPARCAMKLQNLECYSQPSGRILSEAMRVRSWPPGEVYRRCQSEWQQRADPNLLSQDSQKKNEANVSLKIQSNPPQMLFFFRFCEIVKQLVWNS